MVVFFYGSMLVISVAYLIILLGVYKKHCTPPYIMLSVSIIVSCIGYMHISTADNVQSAIFANQLLYLSSCSSIYFLMMCIAQICKFKVPTHVTAICTAASFFFFGCSMTVGISDSFYKSVDIVQKNGYTQMVKEYGPVHMLYPMYLIATNVFCIVIIIIGIIKKKDVPKKSCWLILAVMIVNTGVYGLERLFNSDIEWIPIAFMLSYAVLLLQLNRVRLYNLSEFASEAIESSNEFGFILFDYHGRYEASDDFAKECFPELKQLQVDTFFESKGSELLEQITKSSWKMK